MIKIFANPWHTGAQYELLKITKKYPIKFSYLRNNVRRWSRYTHQPTPESTYNEDQFEWVDYYEPGKYDLAILNVDQQCVDQAIGKSNLYRNLNEVIQDIPKIVCNHGTPMWDERFTEEMVINGGVVHDSKGKPHYLDGMKTMVGNNFMVVNSYDSVERWGWGYPIIHGIDPNEWPVLPKEPRVCITLSPGGLDKYYNRQLISYIKGRVQELVGHNITHVNVNFHPRDYGEYKEFAGSSLIHIYPFRDSPMPRARTEAMMMGCCVLSSKAHNADEFIEQGKTGFIVPDNPLSYAETINQLINYNYRDAVEIGLKAREMAVKTFHIDRYLDNWHWIINEILEGRRPIWKGDKVW